MSQLPSSTSDRPKPRTRPPSATSTTSSSAETTTAPGWRDVPTPGPRPLDEPINPQLIDQADDVGGGPSADDAQKALRSTIGGRSQGSTAKAAEALTPLVAMAVTMLGMGLHLLRGSRKLVAGDGTLIRVWVPAEDQATAIAEPLARIAARHAPVGDGDTNDVVDGVMAGVAVVGYSIGQFELEAVAKQAEQAEQTAAATSDG
jgi:hypothetical protein